MNIAQYSKISFITRYSSLSFHSFLYLLLNFQRNSGNMSVFVTPNASEINSFTQRSASAHAVLSSITVS